MLAGSMNAQVMKVFNLTTNYHRVRSYHSDRQPAVEGGATRSAVEQHVHMTAAAAAELTVEEVGVDRPRVAIELPDVEQVVVLPVHIATHREVAVCGDVYVDQRWKLAQQLPGLQAGQLVKQQYWSVFGYYSTQ